MSNHLQFKPQPKWEMDGTIELTYDGASPSHPGPAGIALRMIIAQCSGDSEALKNLMTARTLEMGDPGPPGKSISIVFAAPREDGATILVPAQLVLDGRAQPMPFVLMKDPGEDVWKVDMLATIEKMSGHTMDELGDALGKAMGDALGQAVGAVAGAMGAVVGGVAGAMGTAAGDAADPPVRKTETKERHEDKA